MKSTTSGISIALTGLLTLGAPVVFSHHSGMVHYDPESEIMHEDVTVLAWRFVNPHAQLIYEAPDADGRLTQWTAQTPNVNRMKRLGLTAKSFEPGEVVTVSGHPRRDGRPEMNVLAIARGDGSALEITDASTGPVGIAAAPAVDHRFGDARDFAGVWVNVPGPVPAALIEALVPDDTVFWVAPGQGQEEVRGETRGLRLTEAAEAFMANWTPSYDECRPPSSWLAMTAPFLHEFSEQRGERLQIRHEYLDLERTIWLDARGHPRLDRVPKTLAGHSVGHWEGDTLVVETAHMLENQLTRNGVYHSEHAVLTEWVTREGQTLTMLRILQDPEYFERPVASILLKTLTASSEVPAYGACVMQQSEAR